MSHITWNLRCGWKLKRQKRHIALMHGLLWSVFRSASAWNSAVDWEGVPTSPAPGPAVVCDVRRCQPSASTRDNE